MRRICATGSSGEESSSKLAGGVAAGIGEGPHLALADLGGQRQHAAEHFAQGRAVVGGDPAAEREQFGVEHGLGIDQAEGVAGGYFGAVVVAAQDDAGEFAGAEGDEDAAAGLDAVAEGIGQRVGERLVQGDGQADVAVEIRSLGHGISRIQGGAELRSDGQARRPTLPVKLNR